jgi:DNA replication protein DnaC
VLYVRAGRLMDELHVAHGDGSFARCLAQLAKLDVLVIDDFSIFPVGASERNHLLEVLDDWIGTKFTLITSQLPVKAWHAYLYGPTLADAILDHIVNSVIASHSRVPRCVIQAKTNDCHHRRRSQTTRFAIAVLRHLWRLRYI